MKSPMKFLFAFATVLFSTLLVGTALAHAAGWDPLTTSAALFAVPSTLTLAAGALGFASPSTGLFAIVATDLNTAYGSHYIQGSQNEKNLYTKLFQSAEFDQDLFEMVPTEDTQYRDALVTRDRVLQPFQLAWTPAGTTTFKPASINLFEVKIDVEESSYDVERTWAGFLHKAGADEMTQPLPKWMLENLLIPQHVEDIELNASYVGVYAAPTPGTAGAVGTSINGVRRVINAGITATTITPIVTGALSTTLATFLGQIETFVAGIDQKDREKPMILAMSKNLALRFRQANRAAYNLQYAQLDEISRIADYPNIQVKGYAAFGASDKIFCTPQGNAKMPVKKNANRSQFQFEVVDRRLKVFTDYWKGYGFVDHSRVYTNDRDLVL